MGSLVSAPTWQHSMATGFKSVMRSFWQPRLLICARAKKQEKLDIPLNQERINTSIAMPFGNVPKKNPGRYFEQFVKVLEPKQGSSSSSSTCFGSPAVGYCNSNAGVVKGTSGRNGWDVRGGMSEERQSWNQNQN